MSAIQVLWVRQVKEYLRNKYRLLGTLAMPLFLILTLGFALSPIVETNTDYNYVEFLIPGMIAVSVLFASVFSGTQIIWDKQFGFLKETLIAPISRFSIMIGQTLGGATVALLQGIILFIISLFIGAKIVSFSGLLLGIVFVILIGLAFTALGISIASIIGDLQGFQLIINFVIFPTFFLSGALFPIQTAPKVLQIIAYANPLAYGVEGLRYSFLGVSQIDPIICFLAISTFALLMLFVGAFLFKRIKV